MLVRSSQCEADVATGPGASPAPASCPARQLQSGLEQPSQSWKVVAPSRSACHPGPPSGDELRTVLVERVEAYVEVDRRLTRPVFSRPGETRSADSGRSWPAAFAESHASLRRGICLACSTWRCSAGSTWTTIDGRVLEDCLEGWIGRAFTPSGPGALASPRSGVTSRMPRTWTPIRRSCSTWTVPIEARTD